MPGNGGPGGHSGNGGPDGNGEPPEKPEGGFSEGETPDFPGTDENAQIETEKEEETDNSAEDSTESVTSGQIAYEGESGAKEQAYASDSYVFSTEYTEFSPTRLRLQMEVVPIPLPYETFSFDDDNFCPSVEEYALAGVDVEEWYAAQK